MTLAFLACPLARIPAAGAQPAEPHFEVASIKPAPRPSPGVRLGVRLDGAQATFGGMSLSALISYAYEVKLAQVSGPDWLTTERFDIVAKLPEGASTERVPQMMQTLLADRFGLKLHRDTKEVAVYALVPAKDGPKLTPRPEDFDPKAHADQIALPILSLTLLLEQILGLPVIDETGRPGQYLFPTATIRQVMASGTMAQAEERAASASAGVAASAPANSAVAPLLLPAGLKLQKKKANLPLLVIESMRQTPTEN